MAKSSAEEQRQAENFDLSILGILLLPSICLVYLS